MYPTLWRINEPDGNTPQATSCLAGCIGWLVLIIGGVLLWNHWIDEINKKEQKELERKFRSMDRPVLEYQQMSDEWIKEQHRKAEEWKRLEEELFRKSKNGP